MGQGLLCCYSTLWVKNETLSHQVESKRIPVSKYFLGLFLLAFQVSNYPTQALPVENLFHRTQEVLALQFLPKDLWNFLPFCQEREKVGVTKEHVEDENSHRPDVDRGSVVFLISKKLRSSEL